MIDQVTSRLLETIGRGDRDDPIVLRFFLRRFRATGRDDLRDALEPALARALDQHAGDVAMRRRAEWLTLFAEAATVSDDERMREAAGELLAAVSRCWRSATTIVEAAVALDACLGAACIVDNRAAIAAAIDELERVVGPAYSPGEGLLDPTGAFDPADQIYAASALLTAYEISARLPYSMLAEELMQTAQRQGWEPCGVIVSCDAARVLCRLASLHGDDDYVAAAVIAPHADYRADAERILTRQAPRALDDPRDAAAYGLALSEWLVQ
jgi:uncharacterized protein YyaL (SSP411 family)